MRNYIERYYLLSVLSVKQLSYQQCLTEAQLIFTQKTKFLAIALTAAAATS